MQLNKKTFALLTLVLSTICLVFMLQSEASAQTSKKPKSKKSKSTSTKTAKTPAAPMATEPPVEKPDLNVQPGALVSTEFVFPDYQEFTLDNGLHVYLVENHELPTVTFSLLLKCGDAYDPLGKEGTASFTGDMLGKGTKNHTAAQLAELLDGVGASISVTAGSEATSITGSSLKKHSDLLFSLLGEEITTSLFNDGEVEKLRKQYLASVTNQRSRSIETAHALSRKVIYGMDNPLARRQSQTSIEAISKDDMVAFHARFFRPNNGSIALVGDITLKEAKALLNKHLSGWKANDVAPVQFPELNTSPAGVYFVARPGSVQSSVVVCAAAPSNKDDDWLALDITTSYMGSSFGSILFSTLREKYSYTYSPFGYLTRGVRYNRVALGSEVRTSVTDSAIAVILREVKRLAEEGPEEDRLERRVASEVGEYRLSFERASNIAAYLQNGWLDGTPIEKVKNLAERMEAIEYGDVSRVARKYLNMFNLRIVVVGSPDVREKLEQFGQVFEFTPELTPAVAEAFEPVSQSASEIIAGYKNAIGGDAAVTAVKSVVMSGAASMTMQGKEYKGTVVRKLQAPNKENITVDLAVMKQMQCTDGSKAWVSLNNGPAGESDPDETKRIVLEARIFPVLTLESDGYKLEVKGKRSGQIVVDAVAPFGRKERYFFDATSGLLTKTEKEEETPQGSMIVTDKFTDYVEVSGVKFPSMVTSQNSIYSLAYKWDVSVNVPLAESDFLPTVSK